MNISYFISRKIVKANPGSFSSIANKIAIASIAIGLMVMIVASSILEGFKEVVTSKLYRFSGQLEVINYTQDYLFDPHPVRKYTNFSLGYKSISDIAHLQRVAYKFGLLRTTEEVSSVIFKGVGDDFYRKDFQKAIVKGELPVFKDSSSINQVVIGKKMADQLKLDVGDKIILYFVQNPPRSRKLQIKGIYETTIDLFDQECMIGDIRLVQKINGWGDTLVGSYEIFLKHKASVDQVRDQVFDRIDFNYYVQKISDKYQSVFDWLKIIERNVVIFIGLILIVACFNIGVVLLILMIERTPMIGILKALGATNKLIRKLFFYNGIILVLKGLLIGNVIGIGLCFIQYWFHLIPLDQDNYHVNTVPIAWDLGWLVSLNILVVSISALFLTFPTIVAAKMNPVKAIRFD